MRRILLVESVSFNLAMPGHFRPPPAVVHAHQEGNYGIRHLSVRLPPTVLPAVISPRTLILRALEPTTTGPIDVILFPTVSPLPRLFTLHRWSRQATPPLPDLSYDCPGFWTGYRMTPLPLSEPPFPQRPPPYPSINAGLTSCPSMTDFGCADVALLPNAALNSPYAGGLSEKLVATNHGQHLRHHD